MTAPQPAVVVDVVGSTPLVRVTDARSVRDIGGHIIDLFKERFPHVVHPEAIGARTR